MKKFLNSALLRTLCTLIIGGLLVVFHQDAPTWLVISIGVLFIIPGAISVLLYLLNSPATEEEKPSPMGLLMGIGNVILGTLLVIYAEKFVEASMYIVGALLIIAAMIQIHSLWRCGKRAVGLPSIAYALPLLLIILSALIIAFPAFFAGLPFVILGCGWIAYSLLELVILFQFSKAARGEDPATSLTASAPVEEVEATEV